jgi:Heterokaryon incompatibility protein (HET)
MAQLASYTHVPITSASTIRVIKLSPAPSPADPIHYSLVQISVKDSPVHAYTALSYTWDNQTASHPIQCDNGVLLITKNCEAALRALREPQEPVTIWIDSICIDQSNVAEKGMQVALMGKIYQLASYVVVWLGEWDEALIEAVRRLKSLVPAEIQASFAGVLKGRSSEEDGAILQRKMHENVVDLIKGAGCPRGRMHWTFYSLI